MSSVTAVSAAPSREDSESKWELAKALYLQELPLKKIAEKANVSYGALKQRVRRHQWHNLLRKAVSCHLSEVREESKQTNLRSKLKAKLEHQINALPDTVTSSNVGKFSGVTLDLARAGSLIEGWSDQTTSKLDIHVLSSGAEELVPQQTLGTIEEKACLPEPIDSPETG